MTTLLPLLSFMLLVLGSAAIVGLFIAAPFWWGSIGFMACCRPRFVLTRAAVVLLGLWFVFALVLPVGEGTIASFWLALFLGPGPARYWIRNACWRADILAQRIAAAEIRNLKLERQGARKRVSSTECWPAYVLDAERAIRAASYRLPSSSPLP